MPVTEHVERVVARVWRLERELALARRALAEAEVGEREVSAVLSRLARVPADSGTCLAA